MEILDRPPYDDIALEYYNPQAHPTCANFRHLSSKYLLPRLRGSDLGERIVEVGAGLSIAAEILESTRPLVGLTLTDHSGAMLSYSERWKTAGASLLIADARNLPDDLRGTNTMIASLADPYNDRKFWMSAWKILVPGGRIFLTMPAFEWAAAFREKSNSLLEQAEFLTAKGERLLVPSLIPSLFEQVRMMQSAGFMLLHYEALTIEGLAGCNISPKLRAGTNADTPLVWGFTALRQ